VEVFAAMVFVLSDVQICVTFAAGPGLAGHGWAWHGTAWRGFFEILVYEKG